MKRKTTSNDLALAIAAFERCQEYERMQDITSLSPNERHIVTLGREVKRLQTELRHASAKAGR